MSGDTFDVRDILYPMTSAGRGRARGVELFIEKKSGGKWFGQANLAYSRARHAGLDGVLRPGAFDRPWVLNAVGGRRMGGEWELGIRAAYLTGRPYTPFDRERSTAQRRGVFELESVNTMRLDDFFALDVRIDRTFTVRDKDLLLYLGVQNVTGRENPTTLLWNRVTNAPEFPGGLERFPLIGLEWTL